MSNQRDTDSAKIKERRWNDIRDEWKNYVPDHTSPWPLPQHEIFELQTVASYLSNLGGPDNRDSTVREEIVGLREAVLLESVTLIHKAGNVMRASANEGSSGYRTWSRSSAYHSAYFSLRGMFGLLGVVFFRGRDRMKDYQVDVFCQDIPKHPPRRATDPKFAVRIICRRGGADHKELWSLFQRILCITKGVDEIWPTHTFKTIASFDPGHFSFVRHQIHYRSAGWVFSDIDSTQEVDDLQNLASEVRAMQHFGDHKDELFTPSLALYVYSLAIALLQDLGSEIPRLMAEAQRAEAFLALAPWGTGNAFKVQANGGGE